jgi:hypothetical protein
MANPITAATAAIAHNPEWAARLKAIVSAIPGADRYFSEEFLVDAAKHGPLAIMKPGDYEKLANELGPLSADDLAIIAGMTEDLAAGRGMRKPADLGLVWEEDGSGNPSVVFHDGRHRMRAFHEAGAGGAPVKVHGSTMPEGTDVEGIEYADTIDATPLSRIDAYHALRLADTVIPEGGDRPAYDASQFRQIIPAAAGLSALGASALAPSDAEAASAEGVARLLVDRLRRFEPGVLEQAQALAGRLVSENPKAARHFTDDAIASAVVDRIRGGESVRLGVTTPNDFRLLAQAIPEEAAAGSAEKFNRLDNVSEFDAVPELDLRSGSNGRSPFVVGHDGRHRMLQIGARSGGWSPEGIAVLRGKDPSALLQLDELRQEGSKETRFPYWKALYAAPATTGGLGLLGAASTLLPSEASAMDQMMSPRAAMADPERAGEDPEAMAARLGAEEVRNRVAGEDWRNVYNDEKPYSLSELLHRDLGRSGVASDLAGEAVNPLNLIALSNLIGPQALSMMLMPFNEDTSEDEATILARLQEQGPGYLTAARSPDEPKYSLASRIPAGYELSLPDMPAYGETEKPTLMAGGYKAPRMAKGGRVKDALAKLFKKDAASADEPNLARRGFLGLNRAEQAPEAETFSGLEPGSTASELASQLNPEMSRRGFMGNAGVAAVSTAFPLNNPLVHGLSTLVEPAAAVNPNAAWAKAMTDWIKNPDLVEDALGYMSQGGRLSNFMENGRITKVPAYIEETMNFIATQPKAIQGDVAKAIDSYFDSMNTLNNAEYSSGLSLESLVDRHPANASLRQQILDEMAETRQKLLDKLPASWDRQVLQSPDYAALRDHDAQVAARISEAGELPGSYADLLEPGQNYHPSQLANIIDRHGGPAYYPGRGQDPLTASQWFDKHHGLALGERAQRQAATTEEYQPFEMMYDNVSGADRFARGGLVSLKGY